MVSHRVQDGDRMMSQKTDSMKYGQQTRLSRQGSELLSEAVPVV
jgi:hypothetical protein